MLYQEVTNKHIEYDPKHIYQFINRDYPAPVGKLSSSFKSAAATATAAAATAALHLTCKHM